MSAQCGQFGPVHKISVLIVLASSKGSGKSFRAFAARIHMGESFQDYSWIQDFEADFP